MTRDDDRRPGGEPDGLGPLLARWKAPEVPERLDARLLASYRKEHVRPEPFWQRFFASSIRVPLPVAVAVVVLLIVSVSLALRPAPVPVQEAEAAPQQVQTARGAGSSVVTHTSLAGFEPASGGDATLVVETGP